MQDAPSSEKLRGTHDVATTDPVPSTSLVGPLRLWRLTPIAPTNDEKWLGGPVWNEVMVCAETSGEARFIASDWEASRSSHSPTENTAGNSAMSYQSALGDPALYVLQEVAGPACTAKGVVKEPDLLTDCRTTPR